METTSCSFGCLWGSASRWAGFVGLRRREGSVCLSGISCFSVALLVLIVAALLSPQVVLGQQKEVATPTCNSETGPLTLRIPLAQQNYVSSVTSEPVTFKCGAGLTSLVPGKKSSTGSFTEFCVDSECTRTASLSSINMTLAETSKAGKLGRLPQETTGTPGTSGRKLSTQDTTYTLTLQEVPEMGQSVYFMCSSNSSTEREDTSSRNEDTEKRCIVQISVWGQSGPALENDGKLDLHPACFQAVTSECGCVRVCVYRRSWQITVCSEDKESVSLQVNESGRSVAFGCGQTRVLSPVLFDKVFQVSDKGQLTEVSLSSVVSNSTLIEASDDADSFSETPAYELTVKELPNDGNKLLRYQCSPSESSAKPVNKDSSGTDTSTTKVCNVLIEVTQSGSVAGAAVGGATLAATVLGFVLAFVPSVLN
ncbi:SRS domain-containing protein [Neospora caninum Liverpool]|uniref:SRS domain-containing protein n=1 Tax=Neospora caninum (strain Liverpool) TaxID=572307 RepID=F0VCV5_NEOCL|nr:SRS domain-containing protein [Neospora caninum Liverpool]CBZ51470.1 SRS domain-containing protein [Neospora caninum Liverpool]|eukprot:XP_003881503.1 SRS domain-containing protein [Neospora caninum Liverpool]